jgi:hypothetical protein
MVTRQHEALKYVVLYETLGTICKCSSSRRHMPIERAIHAHQAGIRYNIFLYVILYIRYSAIFYIIYKGFFYLLLYVT